MTTLIVISDVMDENSMERNDLEGFENAVFEDINQFLDTAKAKNKVEWYTLSDFMTMCNNDEFSVQNIFMTFINIENYSFQDTFTRCGT